MTSFNNVGISKRRGWTLIAAVGVVTLALTGCGGGGGGGSSSGGGSNSSTPSPDTVTGQVSNTSGVVGSGYLVSYDGSTTLVGTTNSSGVYFISVPVTSVSGSDTLTVSDPPSTTILAIQPIAGTLSTSGGVEATQNIAILSSPPTPPSAFVK